MRFSKHHLQLLLSTLLWSGSVLCAKIMVQSAPPLHVAAMRFTLAALIMLPVLLIGGWPRLSRDEWRTASLLGLTGIFLYNICFFFALFYTSAAEGALIMAASPVAHAVVAALTEGERLTRIRAIGIGASVAGIALVVLGGHGVPSQAPNRLLGDAIMFLGMFFWALNSLLGKRLGRQLSPRVTTGVPVIIAALLFLTITLPSGLVSTVTTLPAASWGALAYLVIGATIFGRQLWFAGLRGVDVTQAGVFFNVMPIWSTILAASVLGERLGWLQITGGALVLAGVFLVTAPGFHGGVISHQKAG